MIFPGDAPPHLNEPFVVPPSGEGSIDFSLCLRPEEISNRHRLKSMLLPPEGRLRMMLDTRAPITINARRKDPVTKPNYFLTKHQREPQLNRMPMRARIGGPMVLSGVRPMS
jgi:hypothetical protein